MSNLAHRLRRANQLFTLTHVHDNSGTDPSIEIPSAPTVRVGDFAVVWNTALDTDASPTPVTVLPGSATSLVNTNDTFARGIISAQVLTASDIGATWTGMDSANFERWILLIVRPNAPIYRFQVGATFNGEITNSAPANQTITSASATRFPILAVAHYYATAGGGTRSQSPAMTVINNSGSAAHDAAYTIYNPGSTLSDHTITKSDEGSQNLLQSGWIEFNY